MAFILRLLLRLPRQSGSSPVSPQSISRVATPLPPTSPVHDSPSTENPPLPAPSSPSLRPPGDHVVADGDTQSDEVILASSSSSLEGVSTSSGSTAAASPLLAHRKS